MHSSEAQLVGLFSLWLLAINPNLLIPNSCHNATHCTCAELDSAGVRPPPAIDVVRA